MAYLQVIAGLVLLLVSGDYLVRGAASIATRAGISKLVVGLTIVAFGTSAPEMVVGIDAVVSGAPTLALGNIVGSNIANVLLVLGFPALITPICCNVPRIGRNLLLMLGATLLFISLACFDIINWVHGLILLSCFVLFLLYSAVKAKAGMENDPSFEIGFEEIPQNPDSYGFATILVLGGLLGISIGANILVSGSVTIARDFEIPEEVIGLTLVALGTSLPELATSLMAAIRKHSDVAIGNVIGSNIFNILAIMAVSSLFGDIPVPPSFLSVDMWVMLGSGLILVPYCYKSLSIGRVSGLVMLALYGAYMFYLASNSVLASPL
ncbi:calcium/sodium antiporter [Kordiimonas pumila]|uniref:Calcium/sodium antiporter n=1 Tax=Kordiimonas pumila TaxID=2161677 RepID=A0ABV7D999_9PROT|nr:calcium/sodium antiporter [Kordiimonas pumila]